MPFLESSEAALRGLAAWACGPLAHDRLKAPLERLVQDTAAVQLYRRERLETLSVGGLAALALQWSPAAAEER
jgi:hypothetical protein